MNLETYQNKIKIEKFLKDGNRLKKQNPSYQRSYKEFLKYFSDIKGNITAHHLILGINFTYGWMPTIFKFKSFDFRKSLQILNKVKKKGVIKNDELKVLKGQFNNSLVGTSKLLHFIKPDKFAIWDSRVFHYLTKTKPHNNRINNLNSYVDYLSFLSELTGKTGYKKLHKKIEKLIGYKVTHFRSAELIMFNAGKRPKKSQVVRAK